MKRCPTGLKSVVDWSNLYSAFRRAAKGKRQRKEVAAFERDLDLELYSLRQDILNTSYRPAPMREFLIRDPKLRIIHAPAFRDRVLHHALMAVMGPILDQSLVADTFACREGKGSLAAVKRAQQNARRSGWYCQIDIKSFFPSIDHATLKNMLARKFKNKQLLELVDRIIDSHEYLPGKGLPIGALTSQHFANFYLSHVDRFLLEEADTLGYVRYMDDMVWWGSSKEEVKRALEEVLVLIENRLRLTVKRPYLIGPNLNGLRFCGFRILPSKILLSKRRNRRYQTMRHQLEQDANEGVISDLELQSRYVSVLATTLHVDAMNWRAEQLVRRPIVGDLAVRYG